MNVERMPSPAVSPKSDSPISGASARSSSQHRRRFWRRFLAGVAAPLRGAGFLWRHRQLWPYAAPPVLINLLITTAVFAVIALAALWFVTFAHGWFVEGRHGIGLLVGAVAEMFAAALLILFCLAAAFITWRLLTGILCGYQYGRLAERAERLLGGEPRNMSPITMQQQTLDAVSDIGLLALIQIVCLLIGMIPLVGAPLAVAVGFYRAGMLMGMDYWDFPLSLRGLKRIDKRAFGWRHRWETLGLGLSVMAIEFVPILSALFLTTAVLGAVIMHRELAGESPAEDSGDTTAAKDETLIGEAAGDSTSDSNDDGNEESAGERRA